MPTRAMIIKILVVFFLALMISGCHKESDVKVSCSDLSNYESATGILNMPQFDLGYILLLNTKNKSASYVQGLNVSDSERISTEPKTTIEAFNSALTFSFTGEVPAPAVQANIESAITQQTQLQITNAARTSIANVLELVNKQKELKDLIKGLDESSKIIIVHTIVPAENMSLIAQNASSGSAGTQVLKYGDYSVNITYQCNGTLKQVATQHKAAMFFKFDALKYNPTTRKIEIDATFPATLKGYNLGAAAIML